MASLDGRVALITGGARGMGRSHAIGLAREGASIALLDLCGQLATVPYAMATADDLAETVALVEAEGVRCTSYVADVRDLAAVTAVVDEVVAAHGGIDIGVANAGISTGNVIQKMTAELWSDVIDINLTGTFNTFHALAPHLAERGWGRLIGISSMMGRASNPTLGAYCASKWGVIGLVKAVAQDLAHVGVTVNAIAPGNIGTPMVLNEHMYHLFRPDLEHPTAADMAPGMMGLHVQPVAWLEPEEVTNALLYLVSPAAQHVTATVMDVSAGASARFTA